MIVTVTCNPAIDVTYRLGHLELGEVHRVDTVVERPGGKGVNVSRVLHQLGESTVATGLADDRFGALVEADGLPSAFVRALPAVRRTLVVHADNATTSLWEPGVAPRDPERATADLHVQVASLLVGASVLVVSGSLPPGLAAEVPSSLAALARSRGIPVILDLDEAPLRAAVDGSGAVLAPNVDELRRLVGESDGLDVVAAGRALGERSGAPVVVTLGELGMLVVTREGSWHAAVPERVTGNPTGAGDSAAAAIGRGLARGESWPEIIADAVALSAAAVVAPLAGEVDLASYVRWRPAVEARPVENLVVGKAQT